MKQSKEEIKLDRQPHQGQGAVSYDEFKKVLSNAFLNYKGMIDNKRFDNWFENWQKPSWVGSKISNPISQNKNTKE